MKVITTLLTVLALTSFTLNAAEEGAKKPAEEGAPKKAAEEGAKKPKGNPEEMFKKLDKDANGSVSKEEFLAGPFGKKDPTKAEETFKKKDKDGDGSLSKEEFLPKKKKDA